MFGGTTADAVESLPIRGAWIEIKWITVNEVRARVAPHPGSVD